MTTEKTALAIRVLTAINNRRKPDPKDLVLLRAYCPDHRHCDPDEMACVVIQEALPKKKDARERGMSKSPILPGE